MKRALSKGLLPPNKRLRTPTVTVVTVVTAPLPSQDVVAGPVGVPLAEAEGGGVLQSVGALRSTYTQDTNQLHAHPRDARIVFNDDIDPVTRFQNHFYMVDGAHRYPSVTAAIDHLFAHFDSAKRARETAERRVRNRAPPPDPNAPRLSAADYAAAQRAKEVLIEEERVRVQAEWDEARTGGTAKHAIYEAFLQHYVDGDYSTGPPGFYAALRAHPEWDIYRSEWIFFDEAARMAGCADVVFRDRATGEIILGDWKNTKKIRYVARDTKWVRRGTHPLSACLPDTNYWHYVLQLNFYRHMMEAHYGITVARMVLFNFPPASPNKYEEFELPRIDMAPFFALFPWRRDDPRHVLQPLPCPRALVPAVTHCEGPTGVVRPQRNCPLPPSAVWMGGKYKKPGYDMEDAGWKAPYNDWDPIERDLEEYETELRQDRALLGRVRDELYGKTLVCWCDEGKPCHARVLARYANALGSGVIEIADPVSSPFG